MHQIEIGRKNRKESLVELIQMTNSRIVVEIGIFQSEMAEYVLANLGDEIDAYIMVDPFKRQRHWEPMDSWEKADNLALQAYRVTDQYEPAQLIRLPSASASLLFEKESIDLVFVDGDHSYQACALDCESWYPKIKRGGFISGHDFQNPHVRKAVQDFSKRVSRSIHHLPDYGIRPNKVRDEWWERIIWYWKKGKDES